MSTLLSELKATVSTDLKYVIDYLAGFSSQLKGGNEILLIQSQYKDYINQGISGILSFEEKNRLIANVRHRVLEWIDNNFSKEAIFIEPTSNQEWTEKELKLKNIGDKLMIDMALTHIEKDFIEIYWRLRINFLLIQTQLDNVTSIELENRLDLYKELHKEFTITDEIKMMLYKSLIYFSETTKSTTNNNDLVRFSKLLMKFNRNIYTEIQLDELDKNNTYLYYKFNKGKRSNIFDIFSPSFYGKENTALCVQMLSNIKKVNNRFRELLVRFESIKDSI